MDAFAARKVIDVFEKAEKIAQSRPSLPKEILPSYLKILDKIYQLSLKGKVRVSDVSKALHQTTPSITRALCAMETLGWIGKEVSSEDKRVIYVVLKEKGEEVYHTYIEKYFERLSLRLQKYDKEQLQVMSECINSMYDDFMETPIMMEGMKDE